MTTLIITTENPEYAGVTFGVKFEAGRAVLNEHTPPNRYAYTLAQLAEKFKTDVTGYSVQVIPAPPPPVKTTAPAAESYPTEPPLPAVKKAAPKRKRAPAAIVGDGN